MSGPTLATPGAERSSLLSVPSACGIGERNAAFALSCALLPREARVGGLRGEGRAGRAWWTRDPIGPREVSPRRLGCSASKRGER